MAHRSRKRPRRDRRFSSPGAAPGTLIVDPSAPKPLIHVIAYGPEGIVEQNVGDTEAIRAFLQKWPVTWINVDGLGDAAVIMKLGGLFGLHNLALEDVVNVLQRPKVERYDAFDFIVVRMTNLTERLDTEQLSMFLGTNYVLTFQERSGDSFNPVRERIRKAGSVIRNSGPDYLAYALLDASIDNNFPVLEDFGERLESVEDEVIGRPDKDTISKIHEIKRNLLVLRRAMWPLREAIGSLTRETPTHFQPETRVYLRDCYDHTVQIIDLLENYRDIVASLTDVYLSSVSNRLNEIIKVLTIFTTIFIPMTFICGLYGMNFNRDISRWNMPELNWYFGYEYALGLMAAIAISMLMFFRRMGWIGADGRRLEGGGRERASVQGD